VWNEDEDEDEDANENENETTDARVHNVKDGNPM